MPEIAPIYDFELTKHAEMEMERRNISREDVKKVLAAAEQMEMVREGRVVYQIKVKTDESLKTYILRVFIDIDYKPPRVVTVYRTSKLDKYWR